MIRVVIIDDHPIVRAGMRAILDASSDITVVAEGGSGEEALSLVEKHAPDVLVLDIGLPGRSGSEVVASLRDKNTATSVLILTAYDNPQLVFGLLENGAKGYVLKDEALENLANAVRAAAGGKSWLSPSIAGKVIRRAVGVPDEPAGREFRQAPGCDEFTPREFEVLALMAEGLDNSAIAARLVIAKRTAQNHISSIYGKLGLNTRAEAILFAIQHGLDRKT